MSILVTDSNIITSIHNQQDNCHLPGSERVRCILVVVSHHSKQ
jgi:hypothetical protein